MSEPFNIDDRLCFGAKDLEKLTGIKASTFTYWAWCDEHKDRKPIGPPSFKVGSRRLWKRDAFLEWFNAAANQ